MRTRPAKLDGLQIEVLASRKSEKWHSYPPDVLPAWVAEMDFPLAEPIQRVLQRAVDHWDLGYPVEPRDTGLCEAFAQRMSDRFDWRIDPRRVEIITEVVQGLYIALEAYSRRGEGVVVQTPIYPPFLSAVADTDRQLVENRLVSGPQGWEIDFDALHSAVDDATRVLTLCNPHNPCGRVYTRPELERLAEFALANDLVVVSDEIHCDLVYEQHGHIPFATLSPQVEAQTVTLNSASKSFNIAGLRCAVAHFGSADLQRRFTDRFPRHIRGGMGILGLYASIAAWRESQAWLDAVAQHLEANRNAVVDTLARRMPAIHCHEPEGTYLAWLDCSRLELPTSPAAHFLEHGRVALSDGRHFGNGWEKYVRLNFATSSEILEQVLQRMTDALNR